MRTVAAIIEGKADLADVLFLVAMIVFIVGAVIAWAMEKAYVLTTLCIGLAVLACAWLVL